MITGKTRFFGLIGSPITHSLSPLIHNYLFKRLGRDACYGCFETSGLKPAVLGMKTLGFCGFNVTIPFKEKILPFLDKIDKKAKVIGAVNTVAVTGSGLAGYNTDCSGFVGSLQRISFSLKKSRVLVLGAGGAARAITAGLAENKAERIILYDRVSAKSAGLARSFSGVFPRTKILQAEKEDIFDLREIDLVVNATGLGLNPDDPLPLIFDKFNRDILAYDLIYSLKKTKFMAEAAEKGVKTCNGLWMLIFQAIDAQNIWFKDDCRKTALPLYNYILRKGI